METEDLREYVERTQRRIETSASLSASETRLRLIQPLLTTLGWTLARTGSDYDVLTADGTETVDFAFLIDDDPKIVVETCACDEEVSDGRGAKLVKILRETRIDWGLLTNGRTFVFLAVDSESGTFDRRVVPLAALADHRSVLTHYTADAAIERARTRRRRYATAAVRLREDRTALHDAVVDRILTTTGRDLAPIVEDATESFLDDLLTAVRSRADEYEGSTGASNEDETKGAPEERATGSSIEEADEEGVNTPEDPPQAQTDEDVPEQADDPPSSTERLAGDAAELLDGLEVPDVDGGADGEGTLADVESDTEFVVRFFDGRASVGAVGHTNAATATRLAIEYLLDHRKLAGSITVPWSVDGHDVLVRDRPSGESASVRLENGWYLDTRGSLDDARAVLTELANETGLRAMFQGEWS